MLGLTLLTLSVTASTLLNPPNPYIDVFYTYILTFDEPAKVLDPRNYPEKMSTELKRQMDFDYYNRTAQFRGGFAENYVLFTSILKLARSISYWFELEIEAFRVPISLSINVFLHTTLFLILGWILLRGKIYQDYLAAAILVLSSVAIVQVLADPFPTNRIYDLQGTQQFLNIFNYIIYPNQECTSFGWAARSMFFFCFTLFIPLILDDSRRIYLIFLAPLIHSVYGLLLFPGIIFWLILNHNTSLKHRIVVASLYTLLILFFLKPYLQVLSLAQIKPLAGTNLTILVIFILSSFVLILRRKKWLPKNFSVANILSLFGIFVFFGVVFHWRADSAQDWERDYFIQEFSGRTLELIRCLFIGSAIALVAKKLKGKTQHYAGIVLVTCLLGTLTLGSIFYSRFSNDVLEVYRVYNHKFLDNPTPVTYEQYLYTTIIGDKH